MKPIAFRILDFRSIKDSGECELSGDNITVLAGQNEAGKSAVLMALRDFDLAEGRQPETPEFVPEGNHEARPKVSILFEVDPDAINQELRDSNVELPRPIYEYLKSKGKLWITRDLLAGKYAFESDLVSLWPKPDSDSEQPAVIEGEPHPLSPLKLTNAGKHLRPIWPQFVFFDAFQDQLPRQIAVEELQAYQEAKAAKAGLPVAQAGQTSVEDFLELAGIDLARVVQLKDQDKALGNYLKGRTASITGDFLTYWKQSVDGDQKVELQVKHTRNSSGILQFAFYVHDGVDQFPEQRSKGFLWFLSFYLRLAATEKRNQGSNRLLLIDEPGTFLHAKAQRDVLHLIEDRLAPKQQVVYSTHSPYLLPPDRLHRLRIVLRKGSDGTVVLDRLTHPALRGDEFSDTLSPIITAIGLDVRERIGSLSKNNLLVEGISDHTYLTTWATQLAIPIANKVCIFPGFGASSLPVFASFCVGWGLEFSVLLDRDEEGLRMAEKFKRELGVRPSQIIHPDSATAIEDVFDHDEFRTLLTKLDSGLDLKPGETPSKAIKRQGVDKVLLARKFAEAPSLYRKSGPNFSRLFQAIEKSFPVT